MLYARKGDDQVWSVPALKEHLEQQIVATADGARRHVELQAQTTAIALVAEKEATKLALDALLGLLTERDKALTRAREEQRETEARSGNELNVRLEGMNNFRRQIEQERGDYVRRELFHQAIVDSDHRMEAQFTLVGTRSDERLTNVLQRIDELKAEHTTFREAYVRVDLRLRENAQDIAALAGQPVEMTTLRLRLDAVEARPVAMTPQEQGELRSSVVEVARDVARLHDDFHKQGNIIQLMKGAPNQLTPVEAEEFRRVLKALLKADVTDPLTDTEVKRLREVLAVAGIRARRFSLLETGVFSSIFLVIATLIIFALTGRVL